MWRAAWPVATNCWSCPPARAPHAAHRGGDAAVHPWASRSRSSTARREAAGHPRADGRRVRGAPRFGLGLQARLREEALPRRSRPARLRAPAARGHVARAVACPRGRLPEQLPAGAFPWTSLLLCGAALDPAIRLNSAICAMVAAIALGVADPRRREWIFRADLPGRVPLAAAGALARVPAGFAVLCGGNRRHGELMVITAGVATLAIALFVVGGALSARLRDWCRRGRRGLLPNFWSSSCSPRSAA